MTGTIQVRSFHSTNTIPNASEIDSVSKTIWEQVNTFLATLDPQNVLDIQTSITPAFKYGIALHYEIVVTYLEV